MAKRTLTGKRALITGASSGIGAALALALAQAGVDVVLFARRKDRLDALAEQIRQLGRKAVVVEGDVTQFVDRQSALAAARKELGGLDILVNNAGVTAHGRFLESKPETLRQIMEVNLYAPADFIREAAPLLAAGHDAVVVNVGSILGHCGIPFNSEYCASKFALRGLGDAMRPELARLHIDLLLVSPGTTDTELFEHLVDKHGDVPWKQTKGVSPESVATAVIGALMRRKREIIPSFSGRWLVRASKWFSGILAWHLRRYG